MMQTAEDRSVTAGLSVTELLLFGVGGAILGSWRFTEIGAYRGAFIGVVANLVVSRLQAAPTPRAFFFGFVICGFALGLVLPLQPGELEARWQAVLGCTGAFAIVGTAAAAVVWTIRAIYSRLSRGDLPK